MPTYEIVQKQGLKMIRAVINNETIRAEAGPLHYMRGNIQIETKMPTAGGFLKSMVTAESVFKPTYTGTGEIFFGPPTFGEYTVLQLNGEAWILDRGAYVCCDMGITVGAFRNKAVAGLMGGEGFYQTKVEGTGQVVIHSQGPLEAIDLTGEALSVDGNFAVARQAHLDYAVTTATKSLLGSMASGEGLLSVIKGTGRVYLAPVPNLHQSLIQQMGDSLMRMATPGK